MFNRFKLKKKLTIIRQLKIKSSEIIFLCSFTIDDRIAKQIKGD